MQPPAKDMIKDAIIAEKDAIIAEQDSEIARLRRELELERQTAVMSMHTPRKRSRGTSTEKLSPDPLAGHKEAAKQLWRGLMGLDEDIPYEDCVRFLDLFEKEFGTRPRIDHERTTTNGRCAHACGRCRRWGTGVHYLCVPTMMQALPTQGA